HAQKGTQRWSHETDGGIRSSPAVADGVVYVGSNDGNVYALDADDGTERWTFQTGQRVRSSPAVTSDAVYVGSADAYVYAID
ncbi:MAG: PQQ-binding-like beta-propeller repeat protein, partial [Halapricum sp.]